MKSKDLPTFDCMGLLQQVYDAPVSAEEKQRAEERIVMISNLYRALHEFVPRVHAIHDAGGGNEETRAALDEIIWRCQPANDLDPDRPLADVTLRDLLAMITALVD